MTTPQAVRCNVERGLGHLGGAVAVALTAPVTIRAAQGTYQSVVPEAAMATFDGQRSPAGGLVWLAGVLVALGVFVALAACIAVAGQALAGLVVRVPAVQARIRVYAAKAPEREAQRRRSDRAEYVEVRRYMRRTSHELKVRRHMERLGAEVPPALPSEEAFPIAPTEVEK